MENVKSVIHYILTKNKRKIYKVIVLILLVVISIALNMYQSNKSEIKVDNTEQTDEIAIESNNVGFVDISGEVNSPGVYQISNDTRLYELIEQAGGVTESANLDLINKAEIVVDGSKIIIPNINAEQSVEHNEGNQSGNGLININAASIDELKELNGIGDSIAQRIIDYRSTTRFNSIEDIKNVRGIGDVTYEKIKGMITV